MRFNSVQLNNWFHCINGRHYSILNYYNFDTCGSMQNKSVPCRTIVQLQELGRKTETGLINQRTLCCRKRTYLFNTINLDPQCPPCVQLTTYDRVVGYMELYECKFSTSAVILDLHRNKQNRPRPWNYVAIKLLPLYCYVQLLLSLYVRWVSLIVANRCCII